MTQFDQRYQQVETQYNADHITIQQQPLSLTEKQRKQNRARMLKRVQAIWIDGVLEPSLQGAAQIALELQKKPSAIVTPLWHVLREFDTTGQLSSEKVSIVQVYDHASGEVLILGEPGSGKTTLLLELTRTLLERAGQDEAHPIPVVFPLSSWATKRQSLTTWLASELYSRYQVPLPLATSWIETDQVLPLLDGLDEVAAPHRAACVEAINSYRRTHGLIPTVVCSRQTDYFALSTRLLLQTAVVVQPLTPEQIESYLANGGERLEALRQTLREDADLRVLASTALMLNVLTIAYQGTTPQEITTPDSLGMKQEQVFTSYVQRMLTRRGTSAHYTQEQITRWLSWLARHLKQQDQTIFYLEHLQPDWLSGVRMHQAYDRWAVRFPAILMGILVCPAILVVLFPPSSLVYGYIVQTIIYGGFIGWMLSAGSTTQQPHKSSGKTRRSAWSRPLERLRAGILVGLIFGLVGLIFGLVGGLVNGLVNGLIFGLVGGLVYGLIFGLSSILLQIVLEKSNTAVSGFQEPRLSRKPGWQHFIESAAIRNGIIFGLFFGLGSGLIFGPIIGLSQGLVIGLSAGLISVLLARIPVGIFLIDELVWSWKSLGRSLLAKRHMNSTLCVIALVGLSIGLRTTLVGGLSYGLRTTLVGGSSNGLFFGLSYGLIIGLSIGLSFWLLLGLFQGVSSETIGDQHRVVPNQGIRRSAFNSLVLGFISAGIVGLLNWLSIGLSIALGGRLIGALTAGTGLSYGLDYGLRTGLITGLSAGLLAGLLNGGLACLRHSVIRLLLWRSRVIPWNYPRFLDYAAEHILLRKVGGGYIFLHRLLLDYFANLENGTSSAAESRQERPSSDTKSSKSAEPTGANEHSIVPTAPLASPIILSEGSRLLPCGHEQRAPNAHFCSVCGAPIT